jgi:hypothetical protein
MISDASQLAALDLAIEVATGRRKLNASEAALFQQHLDAIRKRIIDAAARRETKTEARQ